MSLVSMAPSSIDHDARARSYASLVCKAMQEPGAAGKIAKESKLSEATVSRLKNDHLDNFALLLSHLGLKIVESDRVCVKRDAYEFLIHTHTRISQSNPELIWENDQ